MRLIFLAFFIASALVMDLSGQATHRIEADGSHRPPGRGIAPPILLAVAGKPLELHWATAGPESQVAVRADRITGTRRVSVATGTAIVSEQEWGWKWTPPVTRGPSHYEVRIDGHPALTVSIETRDAEWIETLKSGFSRMQWEAAGLTAAEKGALAKLGLKVKPAREPMSGTAFLQMVPPGTNQGRRLVVWDENDPDTVVWRPGAAAGDLQIRAPRWWLSPEALGTDQGLIRFLDLYFEAPNNP